ncbi:hypothetical protein BAE44_0001579, partial [Dichanthelium oligosanthes]
LRGLLQDQEASLFPVLLAVRSMGAPFIIVHCCWMICATDECQ